MQAVNRVSIQLTLSTSTTSGYACDLHLRTAKRVNQGMSEQARRVGSASWCWRVVLRVTVVALGGRHDTPAGFQWAPTPCWSACAHKIIATRIGPAPVSYTHLTLPTIY